MYKEAVLTALLASILLIAAPAVLAVVSHNASQVNPGQFQAGNYSFQQNVGIGTASPTYKLSLSGLGTSDGIMFNGSTKVALTTTTDSGTDSLYYQGLSNGRHTALYMQPYRVSGGKDSSLVLLDGDTGGNEGMYIYKKASDYGVIEVTDSKNLIVQPSGGKVGIGTTSPGAKLEIAGAGVTADTQMLRLSNVANTAYYMELWRDNTDGDLRIGEALGGAKSTLVTIESATGNVGIGTTTPTQRLDLGGGKIAMGYEQVSNNCVSASYCKATCSSGKQVLGGSCVSTSYQTAFGGFGTISDGGWGGEYSNGWACKTLNAASTQIQATAICANIA